MVIVMLAAGSGQLGNSYFCLLLLYVILFLCIRTQFISMQFMEPNVCSFVSLLITNADAMEFCIRGPFGE